MANPFLRGREVPVVETARLRLRAHRAGDFADSCALWGDPNVTRHIGGQPLSEEEVWSRLLRYVGHWVWVGFGYWVIEEKNSGEFVGEMGFADWKRQIEPSLRGVPELGWVLATRHHGKGYATEAVLAAIDWWNSRSDLPSCPVDPENSSVSVAPQLRSARMVCIIDPENVRSLRVAQKCGFQELLRTSYKGEPTILLAR
jgi:RimJ/RimL family protein N-acetyltransferase